MDDYGGMIQAAYAPVGSAISARVGYRNAKRLQAQQNEYNRQMAEWQNKVNVENWQMQNAYNTPAAQMQRLQEAGLNPDLIYGNGSTSTGLASSPQAAAHTESAPYPELNFGDFGMADAARAFIALKNSAAQTELQRTQASVQEVQEKLLTQEIANRVAQEQQTQIATLRDIFKYNLDNETRDALVGQVYMSLLESGARRDKLVQDVSESKSRIGLNESNIEVNAMRIQEMQARLGLTNAQTMAVYQDMQKTAQEIASLELGNKFNKATYNMREQQIAKELAYAIKRNKRGDIELDVAEFEKNWLHRFGYKPGNQILNMVAKGGINIRKMFGYEHTF